MEQIPIPKNIEFYMVAISIVVSIVFEKQIKDFVSHGGFGRLFTLSFYTKNKLEEFGRLFIVIVLVAFVSIIIFIGVYLMIIVGNFLIVLLKFGINFGTVLYITGFLIFAGVNRLKSRYDWLRESKTIFYIFILTIVLFFVGFVYNNNLLNF